jgi:hypothetical protein
VISIHSERETDLTSETLAASSFFNCELRIDIEVITMADKPDLAPEKVRIKDSYRKRIFKESQQLNKSYLETLYFIIDCYFAFKKGAFPVQQMVTYPGTFSPISPLQHQQQQVDLTPSVREIQEDSDSETFDLDFDL